MLILWRTTRFKRQLTKQTNSESRVHLPLKRAAPCLNFRSVTKLQRMAATTLCAFRAAHRHSKPHISVWRVLWVENMVSTANRTANSFRRDPLQTINRWLTQSWLSKIDAHSQRLSQTASFAWICRWKTYGRIAGYIWLNTPLLKARSNWFYRIRRSPQSLQCSAILLVVVGHRTTTATPALVTKIQNRRRHSFFWKISSNRFRKSYLNSPVFAGLS